MMDVKGGQGRNSARSKSYQAPTASLLDSVLTVKHPKVLVTQDFLYLFSLKSRQDELDQGQDGPKELGEDVEQERLDKLANETLVQVMDIQKYKLMDFEFM